MATNHGDHRVQFDMIVAADDKMGIARNSRLPWHLPTDRQYYLDMVNKVSPGKKTALICGRLTEFVSKREKNPSNLRFVLSNTLKEVPSNADYLCQSLDEALALIESQELKDVVEHVWVVGGYGVYKAGIESPQCRRYYITRIYGDFQCDTFCPDVHSTEFQLVSDPNISTELHEENGIKFKFEVYQRI